MIPPNAPAPTISVFMNPPQIFPSLPEHVCRDFEFDDRP
jgi:hypothetical protein